MSIDHLKRTLLAGCMLALSTSAFSAPDCGTAEQLFNQAKNSGSPTESIELLDQANTLCPTFTGFYTLARQHTASGNFSTAKTAFQEASKLAGGDWQRALTSGRIAGIELEKNNTTTALGNIEAAIASAKASGREPSPWMMEILKAVDDKVNQSLGNNSDILGQALNSRSFVAEPRINLNVLFETNSSQLSAEGNRQIKQLGDALTSVKLDAHRIEIIGHTDSRGDDIKNQSLSERRAQAVIQQLERSHPLIASKLIAIGRGEGSPRYPEHSEEEMRRNRRVEVKLSPNN